MSSPHDSGQPPPASLPASPASPPPQWLPSQPVAWAPKPRSAPADSRAPSRRRVLAFPAVVAALAAVAVGFTAYLVATVPAAERTVPTSSGEDPSRRQAYDLLLAATGALSTAPGQHYRGTLDTAGGREVRVDGRVTLDGTALSTVDFAGGGHGDLLDLGADGTYARGDAAFWAAVRAPGPAGAYGSAWVRVDFDALGFDPRTLVPPVLAADLLPRTDEDEAAPSPSDLPRLGDLATLDGVEARQVRINGATVWISTAPPRPRIVRVEYTSASSPTPPGAGPALDLEPLDGASLADFRRSATQRVAELEGALDAQVRPAIDVTRRLMSAGSRARLVVLARAPSSYESPGLWWIGCDVLQVAVAVPLAGIVTVSVQVCRGLSSMVSSIVTSAYTCATVRK